MIFSDRSSFKQTKRAETPLCFTLCVNDKVANPHIYSLLNLPVTDQFQLEPMNAAVLKGSDAQFIARVTGSWQYMTWTVGRFLVLTVHSNTPNVTIEQYSARFCSSDNSSCVEFTIHNISRTLTGPVTCAVQGSYGEKIAQLSVQGGFVNMYQTF